MRTYDQQFRIEAVRLADEVGPSKAARELGIPENTLYGWVSKAKKGAFSLTNSPQASLTLAQENKRLERENRELKRANQILKEAMGFFAASQKK